MTKYFPIHIYFSYDEEWKDVTYPGVRKNAYLVSSHGRVFSNITNKILKQKITISNRKTNRTYLNVQLYCDNKGSSKIIGVHRLVAWEFVENPNPGEFNFVHHLDNNSHCNYYKNLEWTNNKINQEEARDGGYLKPRKGTEHGNNKYSEKEIRRICKYINKRYSNEEIWNKLSNKKSRYDKNTIYSLIRHLRKKDRWKHIADEYF